MSQGCEDLTTLTPIIYILVKSLSRVRLFATPEMVAYQALPSMGFSRQEYWSGVPLELLLEYKQFSS